MSHEGYYIVLSHEGYYFVLCTVLTPGSSQQLLCFNVVTVADDVAHGTMVSVPLPIDIQSSAVLLFKVPLTLTLTEPKL